MAEHLDGVVAVGVASSAAYNQQQTYCENVYIEGLKISVHMLCMNWHIQVQQTSQQGSIHVSFEPPHLHTNFASQKFPTQTEGPTFSDPAAQRTLIMTKSQGLTYKLTDAIKWNHTSYRFNDNVFVEL